MRVLKLFGLSVALVILALAAGNGGQTGLSQEGPCTIDDIFARWVNEVPGFGGLFLDEHGILNVFLLDLDYAERAREFIGSAFPEMGISVPEEIAFLQGEYDFRQLLEWKRRIMYGLAEYGLIEFEHGITSVDIDDARNRIVIGVEDLYLEDMIREMLYYLDIPQEAVIVEQEGPLELLSLSPSDIYSDPQCLCLNHRVRPTLGGLEILAPDAGLCTLGFNCRHPDYGLCFVTCSHCTEEEGDCPGGSCRHTGFLQSGDYVGEEVLDPPFFRCFLIARCRYSDSALVQYDERVRANFEIAGTSYGRTCCIDSRYKVVGKVLHPIVGEKLEIVGSQTGTQEGTLDKVCTNVLRSVLPPIWYLCQGRLWNVEVKGGDSGAPVYKFIPGDKAKLYGILWSKSRVTATAYFSMMWGIERELGTLQVSSSAHKGNASFNVKLETTGGFILPVMINDEWYRLWPWSQPVDLSKRLIQREFPLGERVTIWYADWVRPFAIGLECEPKIEILSDRHVTLTPPGYPSPVEGREITFIIEQDTICTLKGEK